MESFIQCDNCSIEFNHYDRMAKLMPKCGHTLCNKCIEEQKELTGPETVQCASCGTQQDVRGYGMLPVNEKVMKIITQLRGAPTSQSRREFASEEQMSHGNLMLHDMDSLNHRSSQNNQAMVRESGLAPSQQSVP